MTLKWLFNDYLTVTCYCRHVARRCPSDDSIKCCRTFTRFTLNPVPQALLPNPDPNPDPDRSPYPPLYSQPVLLALLAVISDGYEVLKVLITMIQSSSNILDTSQYYE